MGWSMKESVDEQSFSASKRRSAVFAATLITLALFALTVVFWWAISRELIRHLSTTDSPLVYLVADYAEDFSSPEWVRQFSGYKGDLVPVSNVDLSGCETAPVVTVSKIDGQDYRFRSKLDPTCGDNALLRPTVSISSPE